MMVNSYRRKRLIYAGVAFRTVFSTLAPPPFPNLHSRASILDPPFPVLHSFMPEPPFPILIPGPPFPILYPMPNPRYKYRSKMASFCYSVIARAEGAFPAIYAGVQVENPYVK